jgi:hypothetical protein
MRKYSPIALGMTIALLVVPLIGFFKELVSHDYESRGRAMRK